MIVDNIKSEPFWYVKPYDDRARVNGSQSHHCDICQKPRDEICNLACDAERAKIKDGITVSR
jgi:hypothetical protein